MTSLELSLASLLESIEHARAAKNTLALAALLQRKDAICATLAAPEQSWHDPLENPPCAVVQREAAGPVALVA
jgi:hypothetical protein